MVLGLLVEDHRILDKFGIELWADSTGFTKGAIDISLMGPSGHNGDVFGEILFVEPNHNGGFPGPGAADATKRTAAVGGEVYAAEFPGGDTVGTRVYLTDFCVHLSTMPRFSLSVCRDGQQVPPRLYGPAGTNHRESCDRRRQKEEEA